jgi:hypothetical protein
MGTWISTGISLLALSVSGITTWLMMFKPGKLLMTRPTFIYFGPDGNSSNNSMSKVELQTLLYSSSRKGQVVESIYVTLERGETKQNFSMWILGDKRGCGLFVTYEGVSLHHQFLLPQDGSVFDFLPGKYKLKVLAKLVNNSSVIKLSEIQLVVTKLESEEICQRQSRLCFTWGPDRGEYHSSIFTKAMSQPGYKF